jgi:glycosyltransferase involved in cell wall biosynthesis
METTSERLKVSVVIPVYRGAPTVAVLVDELFTELSSAYQLEVVLVNDGSPDDSEPVCLELVRKYPDTVVYVALAKNFGEHSAVMAGLRISTGDFVITMDDDRQNPASEVIKLIEKGQQGLDVVYAQYERKYHSWVRNAGSRFNDRVANFLIGKPPGLYLCSFRCLSRFAVDEIARYTGPYPYVDGLLLRTTASIGTALVVHRSRAVGQSGYTLGKLVMLWLNMVTNFSIIPLRIAVFLGFGMAALGVLMAVAAVVEKLLRPDLEIGWTSLMVALIVFSGIQLILMGTIGEYVGRILMTANGSPQSVIRKIIRGDPASRRAASGPQIRLAGRPEVGTR